MHATSRPHDKARVGDAFPPRRWSGIAPEKAAVSPVQPG